MEGIGVAALGGKRGAILYEDRFPISKPMKRICKKIKKNPLDYFLNGGEGFELLFTISPKQADHLSLLNFPTTIIGKILPQKDKIKILTKNQKKELVFAGFGHF